MEFSSPAIWNYKIMTSPLLLLSNSISNTSRLLGQHPLSVITRGIPDLQKQRWAPSQCQGHWCCSEDANCAMSSSSSKCPAEAPTTGSFSLVDTQWQMGSFVPKPQHYNRKPWRRVSHRGPGQPWTQVIYLCLPQWESGSKPEVMTL